ncbi:MAG: DMT family transporter [Acidimicrobiales bacterium]
MVVLLALAAALGFAGASVLQQQAAAATPRGRAGGLGLLVRLLARPRWVAGIVADGVAYLLQILALDNGPLALVQPVLAAGLLFALIFNVSKGGKGMRSADWTAAAISAAGLAVFIVAGAPKGSPAGPDDPAWVTFSVVCTLGVGACVLLARTRQPATRAALLAVGAGTAFALSAALTKQSLAEFHLGVRHMLSTGYPYGLIAAGLAGMSLVQSAFQAGPLAASLPTLTLAEPVLATVAGSILFGEHIRGGGAGAIAVAGALVAAGAVLYLTRSPSAQPHFEPLRA